MQADPHKLDFRSDLLARLPGAGGLGPLGPIGGALPPTHDLTRPPSQSVFPLGPVNPSSAPFISPSTPHSSFLAPTAHLGKSVSKRHIWFTHSRSLLSVDLHERLFAFMFFRSIRSIPALHPAGSPRFWCLWRTWQPNTGSVLWR